MKANLSRLLIISAVLMLGIMLTETSNAGNPVKIDSVYVDGNRIMFHTSADGCVNGADQWYKIDPTVITSEEYRKAMLALVLSSYMASIDVEVYAVACTLGTDPLVTTIKSR